MKNFKASNAHANHTGSKYACPMKCEGDKTYDEAGNCTVCNMKLVSADSGHPHHH